MRHINTNLDDFWNTWPSICISVKQTNTSLHQCETNPHIARDASCLALESVTNLNLYLMFDFPKIRTNSIARLYLEPPPLSPGTSPGRCYLRTRTPPTVQHIKGQVSISRWDRHGQSNGIVGRHCETSVAVTIISRIFKSVIKLLHTLTSEILWHSISALVASPLPLPVAFFRGDLDLAVRPLGGFSKGAEQCVIRSQVFW